MVPLVVQRSTNFSRPTHQNCSLCAETCCLVVMGKIWRSLMSRISGNPARFPLVEWRMFACVFNRGETPRFNIASISAGTRPGSISGELVEGFTIGDFIGEGRV